MFRLFMFFFICFFAFLSIQTQGTSICEASGGIQHKEQCLFSAMSVSKEPQQDPLFNIHLLNAMYCSAV